MALDRTLSMMEYEDWRPGLKFYGTADKETYHQLSPELSAQLQNAYYQSYPPGSYRPMTAEEMRGLQMSSQAGATSWLDSLLGPGLL